MTVIEFIIIAILLLTIVLAVVIWSYQKPPKITRLYAKIELSKRNRYKCCLLGVAILSVLLVFGYQIEICIPKTKTDVPVKVAGSVKKPKKNVFDQKNKINKDYENTLKKLYGIIKKEDKNYKNDEDTNDFKSWIESYDESPLQMFSAENYLMGNVPSDLEETLNWTEFYKIIKTKDGDLCEAYHTLSQEKKKEIQNLSWKETKGVLYAVKGKEVLAGTVQMSLEDSSLIKSLEQAGFHGIRSWMKSCDNKENSIEVKTETKKKQFYDTNQMYTFESKGIRFLYNHKMFCIEANRQKLEGKKDVYARLPQEGLAQWRITNIRTGGLYDQVNFMKYDWDNAYYKKNIKLMLKNDKIVYMSIAADLNTSKDVQQIIYDREDDVDVVATKTGFYQKETPLIKGCLLKMGASEAQAQAWLSAFSFKQNKTEGKIGNLSYRIEQANWDNRIKYRVVISKN